MTFAGPLLGIVCRCEPRYGGRACETDTDIFGLKSWQAVFVTLAAAVLLVTLWEHTTVHCKTSAPWQAGQCHVYWDSVK